MVLERLWLQDNHLGGELPTSLTSLDELVVCDVSNNEKLNGQLPGEGLQKLREMISFNGSNNVSVGETTTCFCFLETDSGFSEGEACFAREEYHGRSNTVLVQAGKDNPFKYNED